MAANKCRVKVALVLFLILFTWILFTIYLNKPQEGDTGSARANNMKTAQTLELRSPAFGNGGRIPEVYACDGRNINPELNISGRPSGTVSFALIVEDPDAPRGTFTHWVIWNIPPETTTIKEAASPMGVSGLNDADKEGYVGPCPPSGTHHYIFRLFALDATLDLKEKSRARDLMNAMKNHIIDEARLVGLYERSK